MLCWPLQHQNAYPPRLGLFARRGNGGELASGARSLFGCPPWIQQESPPGHRAMTGSRNHLKGLLANRQVALGAQLRFGVPAIAELFATAGYDFLVIDGEHAPQTPVGIQAQLQAIAGHACTPLVRFGRNDSDEIRLALDMGAGGVLIPLVKTAHDVEKLVLACRYPPAGERSYGPSRAYRYGFDRDYFAAANDSVVTMIIIETREAVENIDAILAVEGLDTFVIGTADLSIALGAPLDYQHPDVVAAVDTILSAARRAGKPAGVGYAAHDHTLMRQRIDQGVQVLLANGDEWILHEQCQQIVSQFQPLRATR